MFQKGDVVGLTACSNELKRSEEETLLLLEEELKELGLNPVRSRCIFEQGSVFNGTPKERARALMDFYEDEKIKGIFDISGGDLANQLLSELDLDCLRAHPKPFFGYSDLTVLLNAFYAKTGRVSYLYQIKNILYDKTKRQKREFAETLLGEGTSLYQFPCSFLQGEAMEGRVVGGNIRCFLKLAGTEFMPELQDKILLLESLGGGTAQIAALFYQLKQMGAFQKLNGLLLGTFTQMEREGGKPDVEELALTIIDDPKLPIAKTSLVGHGADAKCVPIGSYQTFFVTVQPFGCTVTGSALF